MEFGNIKWFNVEKGYGFIKPEGKGEDVFVHVSTLERSGIRPDALRGEDKKVQNEGNFTKKPMKPLSEPRSFV